jgi:hypothetical protein
MRKLLEFPFGYELYVVPNKMGITQMQLNPPKPALYICARLVSVMAYI